MRPLAITMSAWVLWSVGCGAPPPEPARPAEPVADDRVTLERTHRAQPEADEAAHAEQATAAQPAADNSAHAEQAAGAQRAADDSAHAERALAAPPARFQQRGVGRCRADADCTLSGYRPGCCAPSCQRHAISTRELSARQTREDCSPFQRGDKVCPPPSPCPKPSARAVEATCVRGVCTAVFEPLPAPAQHSSKPLPPPAPEP